MIKFHGDKQVYNQDDSQQFYGQALSLSYLAQSKSENKYKKIIQRYQWAYRVALMLPMIVFPTISNGMDISLKPGESSQLFSASGDAIGAADGNGVGVMTAGYLSVTTLEGATNSDKSCAQNSLANGVAKVGVLSNGAAKGFLIANDLVLSVQGTIVSEVQPIGNPEIYTFLKGSISITLDGVLTVSNPIHIYNCPSFNYGASYSSWGNSRSYKVQKSAFNGQFKVTAGPNAAPGNYPYYLLNCSAGVVCNATQARVASGIVTVDIPRTCTIAVTPSTINYGAVEQQNTETVLGTATSQLKVSCTGGDKSMSPSVNVSFTRASSAGTTATQTGLISLVNDQNKPVGAVRANQTTLQDLSGATFPGVINVHGNITYKLTGSSWEDLSTPITWTLYSFPTGQERYLGNASGSVKIKIDWP